MGQTCRVVCVLGVALLSLGSMLTALLTDFWYRVHTDDNVASEVQKTYSFNYGLWRLCYDKDVPLHIAEDDSYDTDGSCVYIYKQLIQKNEEDLDKNARLWIHLSRTVLGCNIAAGAVTLAAVLTLMCGLCRLCSDPAAKRPCVYLSASVLLLLATMCGIASGISFIALRDLDNTTVKSAASAASMPLPPALPPYVTQTYDWSFMLHWIGTGLAFIDSFVLLCLLRNRYELVGEDSKWSPYSNI